MKPDMFVGSIALLFPVEWIRAALVLALMSGWVVIALFIYLNRQTRKPYFYLWTIGWLFYSVYLAAAIQQTMSANMPFLVMESRACIGISALFMFWGSFQLAYLPRKLGELTLAVLVIIAWSAAVAYVVPEQIWITSAVFFLLGGAGVYTGLVYWRRRIRYQGAQILGIGFLLWGLNLVVFPYMELSSTTLTVTHLMSALLSLIIAIGMVVEEQTTVAEEAFRGMFDADKNAVFLVDLESLRIVEANKAALALTKRSLLNLVGKPFPEICPSLQQKEPQDATDNQKIVEFLFKPFEGFPILRSNGERVPCEGEATTVAWQRQRLLQVRLCDMSERLKTGQQIRRAEKLTALGVLVTSVANRLNNHLGVVTAYVQVLDAHQIADEKICTRVKRIGKEAEQAVHIVRDLLTFAQPNTPQKAPCHINQLISRILNARARDFLMADTQLDAKLTPALPQAQVDASQLEQVIENLINNAIEAMMGRIEKRVLTITTADCGNMLRITVGDTGRGIKAEDQKRIFDPFFSTKLQGKGAGLGLTLAHSIVHAHGGRLLVESAFGKGSTFTIELPLLPCKVEAEAAAPVVPSVAVGTGHRLLVVDDEPGMIDVLTEVFTDKGYIVDFALGGTDGMKCVLAEPYDLVMLDLDMPDMDGEAFYKALRTTEPDMARRIVFMTGDTTSPSVRSFLTGTGNRWLPKPFDIADALQVVENVLRQKTESTTTEKQN